MYHFFRLVFIFYFFKVWPLYFRHVQDPFLLFFPLLSLFSFSTPSRMLNVMDEFRTKQNSAPAFVRTLINRLGDMNEKIKHYSFPGLINRKVCALHATFALVSTRRALWSEAAFLFKSVNIWDLGHVQVCMAHTFTLRRLSNYRLAPSPAPYCCWNLIKSFHSILHRR